MFGIYITLLTACFLCFLAYKKKLPKYLHFAGWLVGLVIITELFKYSMNGKKSIINPVEHFYQLIEIWLLLMCYYVYNKENKNETIVKAIPFVLIAVSVLYPFISFYIEGINNECTLSFLINSLLLILLSLLFFYNLYVKNTEINILSFGFFWINAGNLVYLCGTFFQMGLYAYILKTNPALAQELKIINHVLNYFLYATYLVAFLCTAKQTS
ncbi:MAG: hypothetical protein V4685_02095 [Bacteroidota bacterium]